MEDISGKKFSLQDWVMRRAANQSGIVVPPASVRQSISMTESEEIETHVETEMRSVSNGSTMVAQESSREIFKEQLSNPYNAQQAAPEMARPEQMGTRMEPARKFSETDQDAFLEIPKAATPVTPAAPAAPQQNAMQQLQIVRLLTDLGDRLRQSEKEREVLWKELETCRKQISDMDSRGDRAEKSYLSLEAQINSREEFIETLLGKQQALEDKIAIQTKELEDSREEQDKLEEKINSIETATGSAIVRVEDAVAENHKLAKRLEAMGQDKARLMHKLESMEETLAQTQDSLKAKALVLLTDSALAARTNFAQTPAWTGNDTLKVSRPQVAEDQKPVAANPAVDLAASLKKKSGMQVNTMLLVGLIVLGVAGGVIVSKMNYSKSAAKLIASQEATPEKAAVKTPDAANQPIEDKVQALGQKVGEAGASDKDMAKLAEMANQIEPGDLKATDNASAKDADKEVVLSAEDLAGGDFDVARAAEEKAVADYKAENWTGTVSDHITPDKSLPKDIKDIETKAFNGDLEAQHDMAVIYSSGQGGVKINYNKAIKWFQEAAHHGVANAQYNLAVLYHQGLGVTKDLKRAIQLYRVAATSGHPEAQYNLGIAYIDGVGAESNPQIAAVYFERAAAGGVVEAAYNLGLLNENGLLGESQPDEAVFWYSLAAAKDIPDAKKSLAQLKSQLSMTDEDVKNLVNRMAKKKPAFLNDKGEAAIPESKSARPKQQLVTDSEIAKPAATAADKAEAAAAPVAKAVAHTPPPSPQAAMISQIEEQLGRLGLYAGMPDGKMSASLDAAIKAYQKDNNLTADGKPSEDLLVRLLAAGTQEKAKP